MSQQALCQNQVSSKSERSVIFLGWFDMEWPFYWPGWIWIYEDDQSPSTRGGSGWGGAWAPPFVTEQELNVEVHGALRARSYFDTAHISIWINASYSADIKHSNLQLPRDSSVPAVLHIQRLIPKGRGSKKQPYNELRELQSSCHKFCVVMVVSDGLRSTLIWSKFKKFSWGTMPPDLPEHCALYTCKKNCVDCVHCIAAPTRCMCAPLLQCLDPPLLCTTPNIFNDLKPCPH